MNNIFPFLESLTQNNNREWFAANKSLYLKAHSEFEALMSQIINGVNDFDKSIGIIHAKDCIFRLYRDVRFSHNKEPYKTNFGGFIVKNGRKSPNGGYYLHLDLEESFIGGGIHMPMPDALKAIRNEIYFNGDEFYKIITAPAFKSMFGALSSEDKLKKPPKGFDPEFQYIDLLKYKSYTVFQSFDPNEITSGDFVPKVLKVFKTMKPFLDFLNRAIANGESH